MPINSTKAQQEALSIFWLRLNERMMSLSRGNGCPLRTTFYLLYCSPLRLQARLWKGSWLSFPSRCVTMHKYNSIWVFNQNIHYCMYVRIVQGLSLWSTCHIKKCFRNFPSCLTRVSVVCVYVESKICTVGRCKYSTSQISSMKETIVNQQRVEFMEFWTFLTRRNRPWPKRHTLSGSHCDRKILNQPLPLFGRNLIVFVKEGQIVKSRVNLKNHDQPLPLIMLIKKIR